LYRERFNLIQRLDTLGAIHSLVENEAMPHSPG